MRSRPANKAVFPQQAAFFYVEESSEDAGTVEECLITQSNQADLTRKGDTRRETWGRGLHIWRALEPHEV